MKGHHPGAQGRIKGRGNFKILFMSHNLFRSKVKKKKKKKLGMRERSSRIFLPYGGNKRESK